MSEINLFEIATRDAYRWVVEGRKLSVEDLWKLPLLSKQDTSLSLDMVAATTYDELQKSETVKSFVTESYGDVELQRKLEIVKHIIAIRKRQAEKRRTDADRREQIEMFERILQTRRLEEVAAKPVGELEALIAQLKSEG